MKKRNPALAFIFTLLSFGIYGIYWVVQLNNDIQWLAQPEKPVSGGMVILLTIVTFGIYGIYWAYKMGVQLDTACTTYGYPTQSRGILYLVLYVVGLGAVAWILMQSTLNSFQFAEDGETA